MRPTADRDLREQAAVRRRDRVDDAAVAPRQPQHLAVCGDAAHVRAAAAGDAPLGHDLARAEADHADRSLAAVRRVEVPRVAARVEPVHPGAGGQEVDDLEALAVDLPEAVRVHVGDVEHLAVR